MESELTITLAFGFILGLTHAFDTDHVVAVSTILSENKSLWRSSILGVVWGLGHTAVLFLAGLIILILKVAITDNIVFLMEFVVGIMLVLLGILTVRSAILNKVHLHPHRHDKRVHVHFHFHKLTESHHHSHRSLFAGILQGLAGSAALMLITLSAMKTTIYQIFFILTFGVGSIVGMATVSTIIGLPLFLISSHFDRISRGTRVFIGFISISLGVLTMWKNFAV